jgi:hypothetical protein
VIEEYTSKIGKQFLIEKYNTRRKQIIPKV